MTSGFLAHYRSLPFVSGNLHYDTTQTDNEQQYLICADKFNKHLHINLSDVCVCLKDIEVGCGIRVDVCVMYASLTLT